MSVYMIFTINLSAEEINTYGPIKPGELLWKIATKISPPSINRYQVIIALHQKNPHAFSVFCNMNSLKIGAILEIPSLIEMQKYTKKEALNELNRQSAEWKNRRNNPINCPSIIEKPKILEITPPIIAEKLEVKEPKIVDIEPITIEPKIPNVVKETSNNVTPEPDTNNPNPIISEPSLPISAPNNSVQKEQTSSAIYFIFWIVIGIFITILIAWLLHKYAKKQEQEQEDFSEPIEEMPYRNFNKPTENTDKLIDEK